MEAILIIILFLSTIYLTLKVTDQEEKIRVNAKYFNNRITLLSEDINNINLKEKEMPSKSKKQARLMAAAAHSKGGYDGVPQSVGKEFNNADKGTGILKGKRPKPKSKKK